MSKSKVMAQDKKLDAKMTKKQLKADIKQDKKTLNGKKK